MDQKTFTVMIETPRGSAEKYNYDPDLRGFKLGKILPVGMVFPYDFGFIPGTKGEDGDPLDVLVVSEFQSFPGCLMECRILGAMKAKQSSKGKKSQLERNDRFVAVSVLSHIFEEVESIDDLPARKVKELEDFFVNYNRAEDKQFKPLGWAKPKEAVKLIRSQSDKKGGA